jgi:hypothetical protein
MLSGAVHPNIIQRPMFMDSGPALRASRNDEFASSLS